jgi:hypothetical protein
VAEEGDYVHEASSSPLEPNEVAVALSRRDGAVVVRRGGTSHRLEPAAFKTAYGYADKLAVSDDGRLAAACDDASVVVWDVDSGKLLARRPIEPGTRSLAIPRTGDRVITATNEEITWIALPPREAAADASAPRDDRDQRLHLRMFAPLRPGEAPRIFVEALDGRIDGDPEVLDAVRYNVGDAYLTLAEVRERFGADPRTPNLLATWGAASVR